MNARLPMANELLDLRGLRCPMPVLMLRRFLKKIPSGISPNGTTIEVLVSDPQAHFEFQHYCGISGDVFESWQKQDNDYHCVIVRM